MREAWVTVFGGGVVAGGSTLLLAVALGWGVLGGRGLTQGVTWSPLGMSLPAEALEHARSIATVTRLGFRLELATPTLETWVR